MGYKKLSSVAVSGPLASQHPSSSRLPVLPVPNTEAVTAPSPMVNGIPRLTDIGQGRFGLVVQGSPFLCLAGELQNSSFSSPAFMAEQWNNLKRMNLNTVLFAVSWEQIEPEQGRFDFSQLMSNIKLARQHGIKLILVWFGSYKNGMSTYVPGWVKRDAQRFPRAIINTKEMRMVEVLSPFCQANWQADSRAFAALMSFIKTVDSEHQTFIMVQVENEPGLLGDSRDRSSVAEQSWQQGVPLPLVDGLRQRKLHPALLTRLPNVTAALSHPNQTSWTDLFGKHADEAFMADAISRYVQHVAAAGKHAYPLPSFVNIWLSCDDANILDLEGIPLKHNMNTAAGGGAVAGDYPSGGATPLVFDIWKVNAPSIDLLAPDVYLHNFRWACQQYAAHQTALLIPEMRRDAHGARRIMHAYGSYNCIAASPFGIDTLDASQAAYTKVFGLLFKVRRQLLAARPGHDSFGFFFDEMQRSSSSFDESWTKTFGEWQLTIKRAHVFGVAGPGCGIVLRQDDDRFLCLGWGFSVFFKSVSKSFTGILSAQELEYDLETDSLKPLRLLNGDETMSGACLIMPNEVPDEGGFPIPITIPAHTAIAECTPYAI